MLLIHGYFSSFKGKSQDMLSLHIPENLRLQQNATHKQVEPEIAYPASNSSYVKCYSLRWDYEELSVTSCWKLEQEPLKLES